MMRHIADFRRHAAIISRLPIIAIDTPLLMPLITPLYVTLARYAADDYTIWRSGYCHAIR